MTPDLPAAQLIEEVRGNDPQLARAVAQLQVTLSIVSLVLYSAPVWIGGPPYPTIRLSGLVIGIGLMFVAIVAHELIHASVLIVQGARPRFVVTVSPLAILITTDVRVYSRSQILTFLLVPVVLVAPALVVASWLLYPTPLWLPVAVAGWPALPVAAWDLLMAWRFGRHAQDVVIVNGEGAPARIYRSRP